MTKPLPWFEFADHGGRPWRVGLSCADDSPDLRDAHGVTYFASSAVLIDAENQREDQDAIVLHELLHVACADHYGRDKDEERIVSKAAPRLLRILRQFGLRFPRRPQGVAALERRARGEDEDDGSE